MTSAYVKFTRSCNCDAPPLPSVQTRRADSEQEGFALTVDLHLLVCPVCRTPWKQGRVEQTVD